MSTRTCSNPPVTTESTANIIPDLVSRPSLTNHEGSSSWLPTSEPNETQLTGDDEDPPAAEVSVLSSTATATQANRSSGTKRKSSSKSGSGYDPVGLEAILADNSKHRMELLQARERTDRMKIEALNMRTKLEAASERKKLKLEDRRLRMLEREASIKIKQAEMEEARKRFEFVKKLKKIGHSLDDIDKFMDSQIGRMETGGEKSDDTDSESEDSGLDSSASVS